MLESVAPGKLSVSTGPYRAIQTHPPVIFRNSDEVDLHYQGEQIQPPQVTAHHVDFYKRPGKRAWAHPELWNDDGTGGMIFPTLFQMAMRGVDGVGQSGPVGPGWNNRDPDRADPRSGGPARLRHSGPLIRHLDAMFPGTARPAASGSRTRRMPIEWRLSFRPACSGSKRGMARSGGAYFDALFEAYNACLYAHRPASFVFVEDLQARYSKALQGDLVVGQQLELDPPLAAALEQARRSGVQSISRWHLPAGTGERYLPLGIKFDRVSQDPSAWQDDAAYDRFPRYFKAPCRIAA